MLRGKSRQERKLARKRQFEYIRQKSLELAKKMEDASKSIISQNEEKSTESGNDE